MNRHDKSIKLCDAITVIEAVELLIVDAQIRIAQLDSESRRQLEAPITAAILLLSSAREDIEAVSDDMERRRLKREQNGKAVKS